LFVPLAEEGWADHPVTRQVAEEYLSELRSREIDTLVLGCTHYPLLRPVIEQIMDARTIFIDSGEAVADEARRILEERGITRVDPAPPTERFFVTDFAARFRRVAELFLGRPLEGVETVELGGA
jgi:glutamate racemase